MDAFTDQVFGGNPAAVCPLSAWLPDALLQAIAEENNLAETAFFVPLEEDYFKLRWFTPIAEVDLCGHATLATAFVLFNQLGHTGPRIHFQTRSGELVVSRGEAGEVHMIFPAVALQPCEAPPALLAGLGAAPLQTLQGMDYVAVYASEHDILALAPDLPALRQLPLRGVVATAPGRGADFVSRFFCPKLGIDEDPVTGSAHCELAPFWSARLGRTLLTARQVSRRGGRLACQVQGEKVTLIGHAALYMTALIVIPSPSA